MARMLDSALGPLARLLEARDMQLLGRGATTRLAVAYNRLKLRRHDEFRRSQFRDHLAELLRDNGEPALSVSMEDGWAIDSSGRLPHLDRLMEECGRIIDERGGRPAEDFGRPFFQSLSTVADASRFPSFLDFATTSDVVGPLAAYMGSIPHLSRVLPRGYRLVESNRKLDPQAGAPPRSSQLWHLDYHSTPTIYVIVALREIGPESGPLHYIGADLSRRVVEALDYWSRGTPFLLTDERMFELIDRKDVMSFCAPAGTVLFIDSNRCFHYGSRDAWPPRLQMQYSYLDTLRTDFTGPLRRSQLQTYPVDPTASRLRKMVLDHEYLE